ncbi:hypothetical protein [Neoroseomonas lacus]|uniref:Uncharacterized protein n=1 Tax=Neoroseomonas lacus TaxID=287609 RepID=A0A917NNK2_9PROT|nr:hypothetical protein [Neoroseomonas lacus]GGJ14052.1 hypothetical protein GCM10011320_21670 [Neoroseomonas lacus]
MSEVSAAPFVDFWHEAASVFMSRLDPPRRGSKEGEAPAWIFADIVATHGVGNLARVLAGMGLVSRIFHAPRFGTPLWYENRLRSPALRDACGDEPVFLMAGKDGAHVAWVASATGHWMTVSRGARGLSLTELGAFIWEVGRGEAARRIVRICGYRSVPRVGDLR